MMKGQNITMIIKVIFSALTLAGILCSCRFISKIDRNESNITDVKIYKDTAAWELALAVKDQKVKIIEKILKDNKELINYQEPKYGATLLLWAIGMEKYDSAETLLKCGADPDIASTSEGETPLFLASGYSWVDKDAKKDVKYVKLLLSYGADPNKNYVGSNIDGKKTIIEPGTSPLMYSISCGIEKTKALVEAGADINYKTKRGKTAAIEALLEDGSPEYAHYLIVQKKAKITEPYYRRESYGNEDPNEKFYPVTLLRDWVYKLDSKEYRMKMDIIEEFARQGVNYWDAKIYNDTLEHIKKLYPDTWEEYLKKY
ncbi:ankyrin repeat domain-containing protein [Pseudobacteroides cellulosolvens]|uniref:Ankyrin repeat-containing domain-containing protein n=1 Tax=Pseudobacteroides cellulosolvens ATCC 35603 = DSM 2933 TaxID=398512 RepID=A0A0L6JL44_9FIRM|nr:ankyrin repeat domain-containing protein [Pseudobacteroides cellulosolvens]KNY26499.1 Ankyrin repeat-containing domain-containing protein [Pseudobacteroides cellulosolvens ATCC 35603 = DSM 2933]